MNNNILNNAGVFAGCIALVLFIGYFLWHRRRENKISRASMEFRNKILAELKGLYPITKYWEKEVFERCKGSIAKIESAAAEFRRFVPGSSKKSFDTALKNYCEHCRAMTWTSYATFNILPGEIKAGEEGPKEIFRQNVNALLSFAKKA